MKAGPKPDLFSDGIERDPLVVNKIQNSSKSVTPQINQTNYENDRLGSHKVSINDSSNLTNGNPMVKFSNNSAVRIFKSAENEAENSMNIPD